MSVAGVGASKSARNNWQRLCEIALGIEGLIEENVEIAICIAVEETDSLSLSVLPLIFHVIFAYALCWFYAGAAHTCLNFKTHLAEK